MGRRKLSQRQRRHATQRQQAQLDATDLNHADTQQGQVVARHGAHVEVLSDQHSLYRCSLRQNLPALVAGDYVRWQPSNDRQGVVEALVPRQNLLERPTQHQRPRPVAANIDQLLLVVAPMPVLSIPLLDRTLAAAEINQIPTTLVLNKADLLAEDAQVLSQLAPYQAMGYELLQVSCYQPQGLEALQAALSGQTSIFIGQSGVGKSSLTQHFLPEQAIRVGAISEQSGLGRHTTSTSRLYALPFGGRIIDAPGIRDFALWHIANEDLARGFREFQPWLGQCQFRNCQHLHEPGCAILAAQAEGHISAARLDSYQQLITSERAPS